MATTNTTSSTSSRSPFKPPEKGSTDPLAPKASKRKSKKKSSKSSSRGPKKTKFFPQPSRHRRRRFPSGTSASSRRGMRPSQLSFGQFPAFFQRHPLLVPSISSFYPPGASPLAPGTPVTIPGLPPLIAGNPIPLPPGAFQQPPFMGMTPAAAAVPFPIPTGGGGPQQPIVLPFPIPMPMPMPSAGSSHAPIVIPAPPPAPPAPAQPIPYPISAPAAPQGGGGGSDTMAMMMMMKAMQQDRQATNDQRERESEEREERKREEERRERKKEKAEEKKRKKQEKEEERKRRKEEREKAMEERKKEIERLEEENRRQIEEAQKQAEEAAAKKQAEKEEAMAKKAEEEQAKRKQKEEEEEAKKKQREEEERAEIISAGDALKDAAVAEHLVGAAAGAVEEQPLIAEDPYAMAYDAPPENLPPLDIGIDLNPALQITEPSSTGRLLCFILIGLIAFLVIVAGLLYVFAPELLPFPVNEQSSSAAAAAETTREESLRVNLDIDGQPIESDKLPSVTMTARNSSVGAALPLKAGTSKRALLDETVSTPEANTVEIALNDQQWVGAVQPVDKERSSTRDNAHFAHNFTVRSAHTPLQLFDIPDNATADVMRQEGAISVPLVRKLKVGTRDHSMTPVATLMLGAFLDRNYKANLKARLFAEGAFGNDAYGGAASRRSQSSAYADIWGDGEDDKASTSFTFEASTKSAIRELLESVKSDNHVIEDVPDRQAAWRTPADMTKWALKTQAENADAMATDFTTELETIQERGLTLEDFKVYNIPGTNLFGSVFERTFEELKRAKVKPVK